MLHKLPPQPEQPSHPLNPPLSLLCTCLTSHLGMTDPTYHEPAAASALLGAAETLLLQTVIAADHAHSNEQHTAVG